ncbi:MAG: ATP synthase F1 subunit delta [Thermodesulfobacteriota bacterium]
MISFTIAKRYARAFIEIGLQEKAVEVFGEELKSLAEVLRENPKLRYILFSSIYASPIRKGIFQALSASLHLSLRTKEFIELLIDRDRMNHFFEILKAYENLGDEILNRQRAILVTPLDLPLEAVATIKTQLEEKTGKEVLLSVEKDQSLIGGVLVKIGNTIYDGSLLKQMQRIKENLYKE